LIYSLVLNQQLMILKQKSLLKTYDYQYMQKETRKGNELNNIIINYVITIQFILLFIYIPLH